MNPVLHIPSVTLKLVEKFSTTTQVKNYQLTEVKSIPWLFYSNMSCDCWILTADESKISLVTVGEVPRPGQPLEVMAHCQGPSWLLGLSFITEDASRCDVARGARVVSPRAAELGRHGAGEKGRKLQGYLSPLPLFLSSLTPKDQIRLLMSPSIPPPSHSRRAERSWLNSGLSRKYFWRLLNIFIIFLVAIENCCKRVGSIHSLFSRSIVPAQSWLPFEHPTSVYWALDRANVPC